MNLLTGREEFDDHSFSVAAMCCVLAACCLLIFLLCEDSRVCTLPFSAGRV